MTAPVLTELQTTAFAAHLKASLERPLGKLHVPVEARLRLQVCDLASATLRYYLAEQGVESQLVQSESESLANVAISHTFLLAGDTVIDPTYGQFLALAGSHPLRDAEHYPTPEIAVFPATDPSSVIETLARAGESFPGNPQPGPHEIRHRLPGEFTQAISGIWDLSNFQPARLDTAVQRFGALAAARLVESAPHLFVDRPRDRAVAADLQNPSR